MELTSITFITVLTLLIFLIYLGIKKKRQQTAELLSLYRNAIAQGDKLKALIADRNYYASMRPGGRLTIYDEQAITNDLLRSIIKFLVLQFYQ